MVGKKKSSAAEPKRPTADWPNGIPNSNTELCVLCKHAASSDTAKTNIDPTIARLGRHCSFEYDDVEYLAHRNCLYTAPNLHNIGMISDEIAFGHSPENVIKEARRGNRLPCCFCKKKGAVHGCSVKTCRRSFHLYCAVKCNYLCLFRNNHTVYCEKHAKDNYNQYTDYVDAPAPVVPAPALVVSATLEATTTVSGSLPAATAEAKAKEMPDPFNCCLCHSNVFVNDALNDADGETGDPLVQLRFPHIKEIAEMTRNWLALRLRCTDKHELVKTTTRHSLSPSRRGGSFFGGRNSHTAGDAGHAAAAAAAEGNFVHRWCLERLSERKGRNSLVCPACNQHDSFVAYLERNGIFVELKANDDHELIDRYEQCTATDCLVDLHGRNTLESRRVKHDYGECDIGSCSDCGRSIHAKCSKSFHEKTYAENDDDSDDDDEDDEERHASPSKNCNDVDDFYCTECFEKRRRTESRQRRTESRSPTASCSSKRQTLLSSHAALRVRKSLSTEKQNSTQNLRAQEQNGAFNNTGSSSSSSCVVEGVLEGVAHGRLTRRNYQQVLVATTSGSRSSITPNQSTSRCSSFPTPAASSSNKSSIKKPTKSSSVQPVLLNFLADPEEPDATVTVEQQQQKRADDDTVMPVVASDDEPIYAAAKQQERRDDTDAESEYDPEADYPDSRSPSVDRVDADMHDDQQPQTRDKSPVGGVVRDHIREGSEVLASSVYSSATDESTSTVVAAADEPAVDPAAVVVTRSSSSSSSVLTFTTTASPPDVAAELPEEEDETATNAMHASSLSTTVPPPQILGPKAPPTVSVPAAAAAIVPEESVQNRLKRHSSIDDDDAAAKTNNIAINLANKRLRIATVLSRASPASVHLSDSCAAARPDCVCGGGGGGGSRLGNKLYSSPKSRRARFSTISSQPPTQQQQLREAEEQAAPVLQPLPLPLPVPECDEVKQNFSPPFERSVSDSNDNTANVQPLPSLPPLVVHSAKRINSKDEGCQTDLSFSEVDCVVLCNQHAGALESTANTSNSSADASEKFSSNDSEISTAAAAVIIGAADASVTSTPTTLPNNVLMSSPNQIVATASPSSSSSTSAAEMALRNRNAENNIFAEELKMQLPLRNNSTAAAVAAVTNSSNSVSSSSASVEYDDSDEEIVFEYAVINVSSDEEEGDDYG